MPEERVSWKDSNLALVGSDLDHKIKQAAAEGESAWTGLGEKPCLKVWRIEQFKVVPWPENKYGRFHVGDSYIVLHSYQEDPNDPKLNHDLHIWIGKDSSQDEYGTAAYKMVECDDFLGDAAIQHRQVQAHESSMFKEYFNGRLLYLAGGVASGFRHVEEETEKPYLYCIKGTEKAMALNEVDIKKGSLNSGDCFILFLSKEKVFLWNGEESNPDEKMRANTVAEGMCTEGNVVVLDQNANDTEDEAKEFWDSLPGEMSDIGPANHEEDKTIKEFVPTLFRLPGKGEGDITKVAEGEKVRIGFGRPEPKIKKSELDETDVFLLDSGWELYLWMGKKADRSERLAAMGHVDHYGNSNPRAKNLPVSIVKAGWETAEFNSYFI
eukprot:CAMPEP_0116849434 /NCGR_PEP_ID=MMETSP0418-20121206/15572_1 /TAXON_ID=1158023 /ORGANISM="Astrosyne radiata, Strain 13vi08-1A" /LENGTH=380 /DNA_ID=CAMNT_0004481159 /DNA_START=24 /DNA_END=1166 /DNA_ORIENTATION=+